ncbi:MAG TPA: hypothetical protein VFF30_12730 [Nitrososphaerales archaeon]|nr:hypothetical protein [Nitrososphaerales archaeon]
MNGKAKTVSVVAAGILLAAGIIGGVTVLQRAGVLPEITGTSLTQTFVSSSYSTTSSVSSSLSTVSSGSSGQQGGSGSLVILLHDPPNVPLGVTAVFVSYSGIAIQPSQGPSWIELNQSGSIDLMSVVNFTQTIANVKLMEGSFDMLRMNLSSVVVTFNSRNYTAYVPTAYLTVPIAGGLQVQNLGTSGAVIDVSPTIIKHTSYNSTGAASVSFSMVPSAKAYVVPPSQLVSSHLQVGDREDLRNENWLTTAISTTDNQTSFEIASAALSNSSFYITIKNTGNTSVLIGSIFITSNASQTQGLEGSDGVDIGSSSILFTVLSNGSLSPFANYGEGDSGDQLQHSANFGYNLSSHSYATFSYIGHIPPSVNSTTSGESESGVSDNAIGVSMNSNFNNSQEAQNPADGGNSTTSTSVSTSTYSASSQSAILDGSSNGLQIIRGQSYIVGVISGDITTSASVTAA